MQCSEGLSLRTTKKYLFSITVLKKERNLSHSQTVLRHQKAQMGVERGPKHLAILPFYIGYWSQQRVRIPAQDSLLYAEISPESAYKKREMDMRENVSIECQSVNHLCNKLYSEKQTKKGWRWPIFKKSSNLFMRRSWVQILPGARLLVFDCPIQFTIILTQSVLMEENLYLWLESVKMDSKLCCFGQNMLNKSVLS